MQNYVCSYKHYKSYYLSLLIISFLSTVWIFLSYCFNGVLIITCPSKFLFHLPCPGCGLTRAIICLFQGDLLSSLYYNANITIVMPISTTMVILAIYDIIFHTTKSYNFYHKIITLLHKNSYLILFCIFEIGVWGHSILCHI